MHILAVLLMQMNMYKSCACGNENKSPDRKFVIFEKFIPDKERKIVSLWALRDMFQFYYDVI